ncbi:MAG TPA: PQQ-binding-like beta-propeller repeat protein [Pyrinomonadaceae bacterium]|nr:PQQ-binding-like beta-propeller repeat protein [Pyrinomonadaceae bacterium]
MTLRQINRGQLLKPATGLILAAVLLLPGVSALAQSPDWLQWGGPHRDFKSDVTGLAAVWPAAGPRRLWSRPLGDGYSAIAVAGGKLFTMYRSGDQDVVIAIEAATGNTIWEYRYDAPFTPEYELAQGPGPRSMPLVVGNQVYAAGPTGKFHCLDKQTGKVIWKHDLIEEFKGTVRVRGYSCNPVAYKNTVIMMVGGAGHALVAFNQKDGTVAWRKQDFANAYSSPMLIKVDGQDQLVAFMYGEVIGVDPNNGELLWSYPHPTDSGVNVSMPVWGDDNLLFSSSGYDGGSRVVKLTRSGNRTTVQEVWANRLMRVHFGNAIRIGNYVYASSGDFGPAPFTAIDVRSGQVVWRNRGIARATGLLADKRFILLDEDGNLALATPTPEGLTINSKVELLTGSAWTIPTLAGTNLYVRDRRNLIALDLK